MFLKKYIYLFLLAGIAFYGCSKSDGSSSGGPSGNTNTGISGSTARFAIVGNTLFTVDRTRLNAFDISNPSSLKAHSQSEIGTDVETLFSRGDILFVGTQNGVQIYKVANVNTIEKYSEITHVYSCDPVVANDTVAYYTLSRNSTCPRGVSSLNLINIKDLRNPIDYSRTYSMSNPGGLGIFKNRLFVCDDVLKMYDISNPDSLKLLRQYIGNYFDVIPLDSTLLLTGSAGFKQYQIVGDSLDYVSSITIQVKP